MERASPWSACASSRETPPNLDVGGWHTLPPGKGLVLVTGPTGCGKSTTLAALVDYITGHRDYLPSSAHTGSESSRGCIRGCPHWMSRLTTASTSSVTNTIRSNRLPSRDASGGEGV
jgi:hypothetical protein